MKTVNIVQSMSRAGGGLFYSVRRLTESLAAIPDMKVAVHCLRDEFSESDRPAWGAIPVFAHDVVGPKAFGYAPSMRRALLAEESDLVHCHGIWMYPSIAGGAWSRRTGRPFVISPHGMLDPWAVRNSAWKKRIAEVLYEAKSQRSATCIRALCSAEAEAVRAYGRKNPVFVIPNGVDLPADVERPLPVWRGKLREGTRVMLYLGRIHPKKNLHNLILAWDEVRRSRGSGGTPWHLVIAGWDQGGYESRLKSLVDVLSLNEFVTFVGPQFGEEKHATLCSADAMILPSLSEGLAMSVLEAWAYRLPVLMTSYCNIPEAFRMNAAIEVGVDVRGIAAGLRKIMWLRDDEARVIGLAGRRLVESVYSWEAVAAQMAECYEWMLGGGPAPDTLFEG